MKENCAAEKVVGDSTKCWQSLWRVTKATSPFSHPLARLQTPQKPRVWLEMEGPAAGDRLFNRCLHTCTGAQTFRDTTLDKRKGRKRKWKRGMRKELLHKHQRPPFTSTTPTLGAPGASWPRSPRAGQSCAGHGPRALG